MLVLGAGAIVVAVPVEALVPYHCKILLLVGMAVNEVADVD
jgi:hypothetical protein